MLYQYKLNYVLFFLNTAGGSNSLVGQFLVPPACWDYPDHGLAGAVLSRGFVGGLISLNQGVTGGLCLAGLLASTPGPRPWSRDMRGHNRSCRHSSESCLSWKFTPCVVKTSHDKLLQTVLCAIWTLPPSEGQCSLAPRHARSTSRLKIGTSSTNSSL